MVDETKVPVEVNGGVPERLASVVGRLGFHGLIGSMSIGALVFVLVYGTVNVGQEPNDSPSLLGQLTRDAFVVLSVAAGGLLTSAVAFFQWRKRGE